MTDQEAVPTDTFSAYQAGLRQLLEKLGGGHAGYDEALTYQQRLEENISQARLHGDNETLRTERSRVLHSLNKLAMAELGTSFNELCGLLSPQAQLETMPLDDIPDLAPLPPGSRMPFSHNPLFVGRETDLKALAATLKGGETAAIGQIAAATGLGGIGKTQLAAEFVHRYGQYFAGGVFWLSFGNPEAIRAEVAACGGRGYLNLSPDFEALDLETQARLVLSAWQGPLPRLLVFDNCEDQDPLARWRPSTGGSRVLVTSRRGSWDAALGVQVLPLGVLSRAESVALLRKFRPKLAEDDARAIAEELGRLPLALHLAGSYLRKYRRAVAPEDYLIQLRDKRLLDHTSLQGRGASLSPTDHELHAARTFTLSYDRLDSDDPTDALALALLSRAAYFAPGEPIPWDLLRATLDGDGDPEAALAAEDGLIRLAELGLLEEEADKALRLHRLLAAFVRGVAADDEAQEAVEEVLLAELSTYLDQAGYIQPLLTLELHLRAVTDMAMEREEKQAAKLCNRLGYYLNQVGDLAGARAYYERALAIRQQVLGEGHSDTAQSLNNLGSLLYRQGDLAGARAYLERALAIWEQVLGEEHPDTASSLNNLGSLLRSQGDLAGARAYLERALAIRQQVLGEEHPDTAQSLNNLGTLLQAQGDLAGARAYLERALAIRQQVLGEEHPATAGSLNNLGSLLQDQGDLAGARAYYERALAIRQQVLGEEHPDTAGNLNNLGMLLQDQGDLAGARAYYERALAIWEQVLGEEHPDTASSLNNLGTLLQDQGDLAGARAYLERALAITEQVLGEEHPATAGSLNNLGYLLQDQDDLAGARAYLERALAIFEAKLGPDHPNTRTVRRNLASLDT